MPLIGERIRDKVAASKKNGFCIAGRPVFGYNPGGPTFTISSAETEEMRWTFPRYIEIKSVTKLKSRDVTNQGKLSLGQLERNAPSCA